MNHILHGQLLKATSRSNPAESMRHVEFLIPGDIHAHTGGYIYDRELASALQSHGLHVSVRQLDEDLSQEPARTAAAHVIDSLPDDALVLIDGLALAHLADILARHSQRLRLFALVHHPAALETGLPPSSAQDIADMERRALNASHRIICTSRWTANQLEHSGVSKELIHVVEPGVDSTIANSQKLPARRDPEDAHSEGLRLICVATITPRKGHDTLVAALARLEKFDWELDCIGSRLRASAHAATIESLIAQHGLESRIHMRGEISREALAHAYAYADLFVLASQLEGYGMVFAEARAAGLPIVTTRGGAIEATLANNSGAIVVDNDADALAQTLRTLLIDRQSWLDLAAAANSQTLENRSWNHVATEFSAALDAGKLS